MGSGLMSQATISEFRSRMARLTSSADAESSLTPSEVRDLIHALIAESQFSTFLQSDLKVGVAGFILIDPETSELMPLFSEQAAPLGFYLPYTWRDPDSVRYERGITALFNIWRSTEALDLPLGQGKYPPEYVYYLPDHNVDDPALWPEAERTCRRNTGCHYVPLGEILCFLLLWRLFLCKCAVPDGTIDDFVATVSLDGIRDSTGPTSLWTLLSRENMSPRELALLDHLETKDEVGIAIATLFSRFDAASSPSAVLSRDLERLGLVSEGTARGQDHQWRATPALSALACYCQGILGTANAEEKTARCSGLVALAEESGGVTSQVLRSILEMVLDTLSAIAQGHACPSLSSSASGPEGLRLVQDCARFPIIPYYYWNILDSWNKCHLVVPIHYSYTRPFAAPMFHRKDHTEPLQSYRSAYDEAVTTRTNCSGVVVIGTTPFGNLDWTLPQGARTHAEVAKESRRFALLREFLSVLGQPIVDQAFYRALVEEHERRKRVESYQSLARTVIHHVGGRLAMASSRVERARGLENEARDRSMATIANNLAKYEIDVLQIGYYIDPGARRNESVDVLPIARRMADVMKDRAASLELDIEIAGTSTNVLFYEDAVKVLITELLENSIKHNSNKGDLQIVVSTRRLLDDDGEILSRFGSWPVNLVLCSVSDNGNGIPEQYKRTIFEPHRRLEDTTADGHGEGLWLLRRMVTNWSWTDCPGLEGFHTDLWEDGTSGARFRFVLPESEV